MRLMLREESMTGTRVNPPPALRRATPLNVVAHKVPSWAECTELIWLSGRPSESLTLKNWWYSFTVYLLRPRDVAIQMCPYLSSANPFTFRLDNCPDIAKLPSAGCGSSPPSYLEQETASSRIPQISFNLILQI